MWICCHLTKSGHGQNWTVALLMPARCRHQVAQSFHYWVDGHAAHHCGARSIHMCGLDGEWRPKPPLLTEHVIRVSDRQSARQSVRLPFRPPLRPAASQLCNHTATLVAREHLLPPMPCNPPLLPHSHASSPGRPDWLLDSIACTITP